MGKLVESLTSPQTGLHSSSSSRNNQRVQSLRELHLSQRRNALTSARVEETAAFLTRWNEMIPLRQQEAMEDAIYHLYTSDSDPDSNSESEEAPEERLARLLDEHEQNDSDSSSGDSNSNDDSDDDSDKEAEDSEDSLDESCLEEVRFGLRTEPCDVDDQFDENISVTYRVGEREVTQPLHIWMRSMQSIEELREAHRLEFEQWMKNVYNNERLLC